MNKTQQEYIRKQAKVKTEPAPPVMRKEMTAAEAEQAAADRRKANQDAARKASATETEKPAPAGKAGKSETKE